MVSFKHAHNEECPTGSTKSPLANSVGSGGSGSSCGGTPSVKVGNPHPAPTGLVIWEKYRIHHFKALHPVTPQNDTGTPFHISYHKWGTCFLNCGRKEDLRQHNMNEKVDSLYI
jgi:hypothetical protein